MQIKTFLIFHLTSIQMIKINTGDKCWQICGKREPLFTVGGNTDWFEEYSKYLKNICYDPDILSSVFSKDLMYKAQVLAQHYSLSPYSIKPGNRNKLDVLQQWTDNEM